MKNLLNEKLVIEPIFRRALVYCKNGDTYTTTNGISISRSRGGGLILRYVTNSGRTYTSFVFNEDQYTEEFYNLNILAWKEHPMSIAPTNPPKRDFIEDEDFDQTLRRKR